MRSSYLLLILFLIAAGVVARLSCSSAPGVEALEGEGVEERADPRPSVELAAAEPRVAVEIPAEPADGFVEFYDALTGVQVSEEVEVREPGSGTVSGKAPGGELASALPVGSWIASSAGYLPTLFVIPEGGERRTVRLWPGRRLVLRYQDPSGEGVSGVRAAVVPGHSAELDGEWADDYEARRVLSPAARRWAKDRRLSAEQQDAWTSSALEPRGHLERPLVVWTGASDEEGMLALDLPAGYAYRWVLVSPHAVQMVPPGPARLSPGFTLTVAQPRALSGRFELAPSPEPLEIVVPVSREGRITGYLQRGSDCFGSPAVLELKAVTTALYKGKTVEGSRRGEQSLALEADGTFAFDSVRDGVKMLEAAWECEERHLNIAWTRFEIASGEHLELGNVAELLKPAGVLVRVAPTEEVAQALAGDEAFNRQPELPPFLLSVRQADAVTRQGLWGHYPIDDQGVWRITAFDPGPVELDIQVHWLREPGDLKLKCAMKVPATAELEPERVYDLAIELVD